MTQQDMLTIAVLVVVVLVALLFPRGPGTPKRFKLHTVQSRPLA
jgi:hypothetical protein